jgi:tape measure domain-containing protein
MATVDDKVVSMSFESSKFESGVNKVIQALDKLKAALKFPDAGKNLDQINASAQKVDLGHIGRAVDSIKGKLSALSVAALAVFANIATKAVSAGGRLIKSLTLDPVIAGFKEYETGLNAVQTILSNTSAAGTKLKDVNKTLNELNTYADKTIYNFSEMTKNIGTFTAAGVDLKTAAGSIKGIANLAALSGSNSQQASTAMYQLSQAISAGKVSLQDWNSVVNAGMGGTVFQRALAQTAQHMGTLGDGAVQLKGKMKNVTIEGQSFRESIQAKPGEKSWLTSDVLTTTLKQLSGDLTDAQLKAQGYSDAQIKAIQTQAKMALNAATQVKTLSQLLDTIKESVGSGWAQTWQIIFGDFGEAKTLFTGLSNSIGGFVSASANARNKVLGDWKDLGGRTLLIESIKNIFEALGAAIKPIKEAFRDIFPATTGKQLYDLTVRFKQFTETLKPGPETIDGLRRTFRGLFALLDIGKQLIGGIFTVFGKLFGVIGEGSGGFLQITGSLGDFLVSVDEALKKGDRLHNFFATIGTILAAPIRMLGKLRDALMNLFGGFSSGGFSEQMGGMNRALTPFQKGLQAIAEAWNKFLDGFGNAGKVLQPIFDSIVKLFEQLGPSIGKAISSMNFDAILQVIRTGLLGGIFLTIKKFLGKGTLGDALGGGILSSIAGSFEALEGSLTALQTNIKAKTLKEIAIAVALLAGSIVALSFVNADKLNAALSAMTIAFGQLLGAMAILTNVTKSIGFIKLPVIAASLIMLAGAVDLLSLAVIGLSRLSWGELAKGLSGVAVLLVAISAASGPLSKNAPGMISAGLGLIAIAVALKILASAIGDFGGLSWAAIGKGMISVAVALGIMASATKLFPPGMVAVGAGLIAVAVGLKIVANVISQFGRMDWKTIAKGMVGVAGGLLIIAGAMNLMPANMLASAAGLLLVSFAIKGIAKALESMGGMSVGEIAKGLIALAGALTILTVAMYAMTGAIAGAAALVVVSAGLSMLAPAMVALGQQSWGQIIKGLIALTGALVILGAAGLLLGPVAPSLLALGAAMVLIGGGLALAGAGIALIGIGLSAIAVSAPVAVGVLVQALINLAEAIPRVIGKLVLGLLQIVQEISKVAPQFVAALAQILVMLVDAVIKIAPKLQQAFQVLITLALKTLSNAAPEFVQTGFDLLMALLKGINNNLNRVVSMVVTIVITLLNTLANQLFRIQAAGVHLLQVFIQGIVNTYGLIISTAVTMVTHIANTIANNIGKIISAGASVVAHFVGAIADAGGRIVSAGVTAMTRLLNGIADKMDDLVSAGVRAASKFVSAVAHGAAELTDKGAQAIIDFMNGVASAIRRHDDEMGRAGGNLASAIIGGLVNGLTAGAGRVISALGGVVGKAVSAAKKKLHIGSPSRVFYEIGGWIIEGLANGIDDNSDTAAKVVRDMVGNMVDSISQLPAALDGLIEQEPVITPILDLSAVQTGATEMSNIVATTPVVATASYGQATSISSEQAAVATDQPAVAPGGTLVQFEQNNYSPTALTEVEIYRQTKNQLSQIRTALATA